MCGLPGSSAGFCAPLRQTAAPGHKRTVYIIRSLGPKCKRNDKKRPMPNICMSAPGGCLLGDLFLHRGLGGDRVLRGCLTIRHYNGYNGGRQTVSRHYTFPPAGHTAGQAPENHTSTRLTCAASTYNPSPFRYWRVFFGGAMPLLRAVRLGGIAFLFLSLLYAIRPSFASCILYKLTKVICIF